jgi:acetyltransferase-like isoleucine patch superfamily enzyme
MDRFVELGKNCVIQDPVVLGLKYTEVCNPARIGDFAVIRAFTVIYADVTAGDRLKTGHGALVREKTRIGDRVVIGSGVVIDGHTEIGDRVKIESNAYIPAHTSIGNDVFIGPNAALTNDRYPQRLRDDYRPEGPVLEDGVSIGANATILPGVRIGQGSFIAAGSVVTKDVPNWSLVKGVPGVVEPLPEKLKHKNKAKNGG